jgi:nifR3 family TIM-barrel protein
MKIRDLIFENNVFLAPLAGYTDAGFRSLCKKYGAGLTYTEMVSAKGLLYNSKNTFPLLHTTDREKIKAVQLFGSEPEVFAKILHRPELSKFDIIDLNCGCPVPKIVKNGEGSALMRDPVLLSEIVGAIRENVGNRAVTVKIRTGIDGKSNFLEVAKACERAGADAITLHARSREQFYGGLSDWNLVKILKESVSVPVIASGDVKTRDDYEKVLELTGCDGVMIGRGALGKPYVFSEILGKAYEFDPFSVLEHHVSILKNIYSHRVIASGMKAHIYRSPKALRENLFLLLNRLLEEV